VPRIEGAHAGWGRTPIDAFILAKLREKGLRSSKEADRRTLIRRLTFDLHGLPPTPEEMGQESQRQNPLTEANIRLLTYYWPC
jgi:hypothetical protein